MNKCRKNVGFRPDKSTLKICDTGSSSCKNVTTVHFADPQMVSGSNTYYAFESKAGASGLQNHGGPKKFMKMVEKYVPDKNAPSFSRSLFC